MASNSPSAVWAATSAEPLPVRLLHYVKERNLPEGAHLKEQDLADAMGVSRTPIRKALEQLAETGLVASRPNRGFVLLSAADDFLAAEVELPVTDERRLFDRIALDRLTGNLPDSFSEAEIGQRYRVSRRMVERVIADLREESVVVPAPPGRYKFNATLATAESSDASYAFRLCLEPQIPLLESFSPSPEAVRRCREEHLQFIALDPVRRTNRMAYRLDADFHEMLAEASHNQFFHAATVQQNRLRQLLEYRDYKNETRVLVWCREHLDILDSLEAGDRTGTAERLRSHLLNAMAYRPHGAKGSPP